jgi:uncharacterized membrane protein YjfL (UPF0719 family)
MNTPLILLASCPVLQPLASMIVFAFVGIGLAILGYKLFDKCTPGDLNKEIVENKNVAAAIIGAAVILGVCIIVAASIAG